MRSLILGWTVGLGLLGGCTGTVQPPADTGTAAAPAAAPAPSPTPVATPAPAPLPAPAAPAAEQAYVGWYMEHGGQPMFQACGRSEMSNIGNAGELQARVKSSDIVPGNPVYVRFTGRSEDGTIRVAQVQQVGSPTPVRDCALPGVVTPSN